MANKHSSPTLCFLLVLFVFVSVGVINTIPQVDACVESWFEYCDTELNCQVHCFNTHGPTAVAYCEQNPGTFNVRTCSCAYDC
ncbi:hypothetical protein MKW98_022373 [Papaver atlanticum]|uniref:Uncharacterized protein n=1 Tax=Papaver atlanticum TaxID=357466 RepID=A0AAD4SMX0_9MAGN|nr:hypothetical protein MKW98_022373 [Papaver atlanticum]